MRMLLKSMSAILLGIACSYALADSFERSNDPNKPLQGFKYKWILGFDVDYQTIKLQDNFEYFGYNYRNGAIIYTSWRSKGPLGIELGYHWSTDKPKNIETVPGTTILGTTATTEHLYISKLRVDDTYLDAYWHYKMKKVVELKLGIGVGFVRQKLKLFETNIVDPLARTFDGLYPGTTAVARFNIGFQTMLTSRIGARALFNYQTTSGIRMRNVPAGVDSHMFSNSYMFSVGVFYTLTGFYDDNPGPNGEFIN